MKKYLVLAFAIMIAFTLVACGGDNDEGSNANDNTSINNSDNEEGIDEQEDTEEQEDSSEEINGENNQDSTGDNEDDEIAEEKIIVTLDSGEMIINVYDNPTSRDLLEQLPLTLTFEEFSGFEKLIYPPEELTTEGAPDGYTPERGDFSYYSP